MIASTELMRAVDVMRDLAAPWYVAGGWAIDLFLQASSREHADVEVALFREDQGLLRQHLGAWGFEKVAGGRRVPWRSDEWLPPPVHEVHGSPGAGSTWSLEFLLNEREGDLWVYRRNHDVSCPARRIGLRSPDGIPFLRPGIVLLYKSKDRRPVDEVDFAAARPLLGAEERAWLRGALEVCHPGHEWLAAL